MFWGRLKLWFPDSQQIGAHLTYFNHSPLPARTQTSKSPPLMGRAMGHKCVGKWQKGRSILFPARSFMHSSIHFENLCCALCNAGQYRGVPNGPGWVYSSQSARWPKFCKDPLHSRLQPLQLPCPTLWRQRSTFSSNPNFGERWSRVRSRCKPELFLGGKACWVLSRGQSE